MMESEGVASGTLFSIRRNNRHGTQGTCCTSEHTNSVSEITVVVGAEDIHRQAVSVRLIVTESVS